MANSSDGAPSREGSASAPGVVVVSSQEFSDGDPIPQKFTGDGEDVSPALTWSGIPDSAVELALICDDPDAPTPEPWVHWVLYGLPATVDRLPEGLARSATIDGFQGVRQGRNSWQGDESIGYRGPAPPPGHGTHHYHFRLYALDTQLELKPGAGKEALLAAMQGHVVAEGELIGTYER